jgi:hypothetical protein
VKVRPGRIEAKCSGAGLSFTLDESPQGAIAARVITGASGEQSYCMRFDQSVAVDTRAQSGRTGVFKARAVPPPESCAP